MKLMSILKTLSYNDLEKIREFWEIQSPPLPAKGASEKGLQKKLMEHLYFRLQVEQYFRHAFDKLSKEEKNLVYFLTIHGGDLEVEEVVRRCFQGHADALKSHVEDLTRKGFVFWEDLRRKKWGPLWWASRSHSCALSNSPPIGKITSAIS